MNQMIEIPCHLEIEPELGLHSKKSLKAKRRVRGHSSLAMDQFTNTRVGHTEFGGKLLLGHSEWFQELFQEHFSRMGWGTIRGNTNHVSFLLNHSIEI